MVRPVAETPSDVEAVRRGDHLFLLNHGSEEAEVPVRWRAADLLSGARFPRDLRLPPRGVAVLAG